MVRGSRDKCNSRRGPLIFGEWSSSVKSASMEMSNCNNGNEFLEKWIIVEFPRYCVERIYDEWRRAVSKWLYEM